MFWPKRVSSYPLEEVQVFADHLSKAGFKVEVAVNPETLELARLFESAYRAVMIVAGRRSTSSRRGTVPMCRESPSS
jgi:hypothetical protein